LRLSRYEPLLTGDFEEGVEVSFMSANEDNDPCLRLSRYEPLVTEALEEGVDARKAEVTLKGSPEVGAKEVNPLLLDILSRYDPVPDGVTAVGVRYEGAM
jgi:hypothetical protein